MSCFSSSWTGGMAVSQKLPCRADHSNLRKPLIEGQSGPPPRRRDFSDNRQSYNTYKKTPIRETPPHILPLQRVTQCETTHVIIPHSPSHVHMIGPMTSTPLDIGLPTMDAPPKTFENNFMDTPALIRELLVVNQRIFTSLEENLSRNTQIVSILSSMQFKMHPGQSTCIKKRRKRPRGPKSRH